MDISEKLDKLLEDVAVVRTVSAQHTADLLDLKDKLEPVFTHVTGMKTLAKVAGTVLGAVIGVISCVAAVLLLFR